MRDSKSSPPPRLVFTLLLTTAVAMGGVFLVRWLVPAGWLHANNEVAGALLLTNGGLVIGSMWLFGLESFLAHALMTLALTGSIAFILYLIADLDNPFWGAWQVTAEPFRRTLPEDEIRAQGAAFGAAGLDFRNSSKKA